LSVSAKFVAVGLLGDLPCIGLSAAIKTWRHSERSGRRQSQCPVSDMVDLDQCGWAGLGRKLTFIRVSKERIGHKGKRQNDRRTVAAEGRFPEYRL
jgi:hypothetical protein